MCIDLLSASRIQVIHEALRLANIAPVVFRKAKQDVQIKGMHLFFFTMFFSEKQRAKVSTYHVIGHWLDVLIYPGICDLTLNLYMRVGYTIPQGSKIMICPSAAHMNPKVYEDPSVFNPWRWKVRKTRNSHALKKKRVESHVNIKS